MIRAGGIDSLVLLRRLAPADFRQLYEVGVLLRGGQLPASIDCRLKLFGVQSQRVAIVRKTRR